MGNGERWGGVSFCTKKADGLTFFKVEKFSDPEVGQICDGTICSRSGRVEISDGVSASFQVLGALTPTEVRTVFVLLGSTGGAPTG